MSLKTISKALVIVSWGRCAYPLMRNFACQVLLTKFGVGPGRRSGRILQAAQKEMAAQAAS